MHMAVRLNVYSNHGPWAKMVLIQGLHGLLWFVKRGDVCLKILGTEPFKLIKD